MPIAKQRQGKCTENQRYNLHTCSLHRKMMMSKSGTGRPLGLGTRAARTGHPYASALWIRNCPPDRPHLSYTGERCWRPSQCGELTRPCLGGSPQLAVLPCKEQVKYRSGRHALSLFLGGNARPPLSPADGGGNPLKPRTGAEGPNLCSRTSNGGRRALPGGVVALGIC